MNARCLIGDGGSGRAAPRFPWRRRSWTFTLATLAGLMLSGCASLGMPGLCNPCSPGPVRRLGQRVFNRTPVCTVGCEPGLIGGAPAVEYGVAPAPAPIVTTPAVPDLEGVPPAGSTVAPPADAPTELYPATGASKPASGTGGAANYQSLRPQTGVQTARRDGVSRTGAEAKSSASPNPLENFVPRLAPPEEAFEEVSVPPAPDPEPSPPEPASIPKFSTTPTEEASPASSALAPPVDLNSTASLAPGIGSFKSVRPQIAAGSLPSVAGWNWLVQQGFRTVLDLRPADQAGPEDLEKIRKAGLRYIPLPVTDSSIDDPSLLKQYEEELSYESARPIYIFDTDGSRSAVLWYLHSVIDLQSSPQDAVREAEEIGRRDPALWAKATAFLERTRPSQPDSAPATIAPAPPESPVPDPSIPPGGTADAPRTTMVDPNLRTAAFLKDERVRSALEKLPLPTTQAPRPLPANSALDPYDAGRYATLLASGLTIPLFFLGRNALGLIARSVSRANPTGSAPGPRSLPGESDG